MGQGVPVALLGAVYYLTVLFGAVSYLDTGRKKILERFAWLTVLGVLASVYFVFLQVAVIKAICLYCIISAATSTAIFVTVLPIFRVKDNGVS